MSNQIQTLIKKCRSCKQQLTKFLIDDPMYNEMLNIYSKNGFQVDEELENNIKPHIEGVCVNCGAAILAEMAFNNIASTLDERTKDVLTNFRNMLVNSELTIQHIQFVNGISESIKDIKLDKVAAYRVIVAALRLGTKPQHVSPQEKQFMFNLKNSGMSNLQLSIIFQRSKETIYRTLKETGV